MLISSKRRGDPKRVDKTTRPTDRHRSVGCLKRLAGLDGLQVDVSVLAAAILDLGCTHFDLNPVLPTGQFMAPKLIISIKCLIDVLFCQSVVLMFLYVEQDVNLAYQSCSGLKN